MKAGAQLETGRLLLRHWRETDLPVLHRLNSDERVMAFFPFRRDREQTAALLELIHQRVERDGLGWCALTLCDTGAVIGFAGLARCDLDLVHEPAVEIGWRLLPEYWGKGYATEAAEALLRHGFEDLGLNEIVSFAVHDNHASTAVMERIGMTREPAFDFDHPRVPDTHAHLRRHVFYRLEKDDWASKRAAR